MSFFSAIKISAKKTLHPYWGQSIVAILLGVAISLLFIMIDVTVESRFLVDDPAVLYNMPELFAPTEEEMLTATILTFLVSVVSLFVTAPFSVGQTRWFMRLTENGRVYLSNLLHFFKSRRVLLKSVWLRINVSARILGITLLLTLPLLIMLSLSSSTFENTPSPELGLLSFGNILLISVLTILTFIFIALFSARYYATTAILSINDKMPVNKIIALSVKATKGRLSSILMFELSFIGWWLVFPLIIPALYFLPYHATAKGIYIRYMLESIGCKWVNS